MRKLFIFGFVLLITVTCREKVQETSTDDTLEYVLSSEDWPQKRRVNSKVIELLKEWPEYNALDLSFDALYNAANKDDLALTIDNIIEGQKLLEASDYPTSFNSPQIKSRQKVFKTYVLKVKGDLIYRLDPEVSIHEMINAYNAYRKQMDVMVTHILDAKLILDEE